MKKQDYLKLSCPQATIILSIDNKKHTIYLGKCYEIRFFDEYLEDEDIIIGNVVGFVIDGYKRKVLVTNEVRYVAIDLFSIAWFEDYFENAV